MKQIKSLKQPESDEGILKNFQTFIASAMNQINSVPPGQQIVLIFTNNDKGTPLKARKIIEDWINQQPWCERVQIYIEQRCN